MEKLKEIEELLSFIPTKSIDEFANVGNGKKSKTAFKINNENKILSFNEISNKINEKINNFNTNKGKKNNRNKNDKGKNKNEADKNTLNNSNKKMLNKSQNKMETD